MSTQQWRRLGTTVVVARPEVGKATWFASEDASANKVRASRCYSALTGTAPLVEPPFACFAICNPPCSAGVPMTIK